MTNGNTGNEEEAPQESYIMIRFAAPGATLLNMQIKNVFPGQMIVAADYLLVNGRKFMEQLEQMEKEKSLIKPPSAKILIPK